MHVQRCSYTAAWVDWGSELQASETSHAGTPRDSSRSLNVSRVVLTLV